MLVRMGMGEFQDQGAPVMFSKHMYSSCLFPVPMHLSSPKTRAFTLPPPNSVFRILPSSSIPLQAHYSFITHT